MREIGNALSEEIVLGAFRGRHDDGEVDTTID